MVTRLTATSSAPLTQEAFCDARKTGAQRDAHQLDGFGTAQRRAGRARGDALVGMGGAELRDVSGAEEG